MMAQRNITDRAKRYRAQNNVTGPRKCVLCGSSSDIQVMHLSGNENDGERENLAYGCRSCNGKLSAAFKSIGAGRRTAQYNPAAGRVPTYEQYKWAVVHHNRGEHDEGGAVIHATPKHKRIQYAKMIAREAAPARREGAAQRRRDFEDRYNPGASYRGYSVEQLERIRPHVAVLTVSDDWLERDRGRRELAKVDHALELARKREKKNPWPFSRPDARRTTPATGGIAYHSPKRSKQGRSSIGAAGSVGSHKGYKLGRTADGEYFSSLDPQSLFETKRGATGLIDSYLKGRGNPAVRRPSEKRLWDDYDKLHAYDEKYTYLVKQGKTEEGPFDSIGDAADFIKHEGPARGRIIKQKRNPSKFDRCVKDVKAKGGAGNAYAVCTAAGTRNPGLDAYGDPIKKGYVKILGRVVKIGSKAHKDLLARARHAEDLQRSESGTRNPAMLDDIDIMRDAYQAKNELMRSSGISEKAANSIARGTLAGQYRIGVKYRDIPKGKLSVWVRGWKHYGRNNPADASAKLKGRGNPSGSGPHAVIHSGSTTGARFEYVVKRFKSEDAARRFAEAKNRKSGSGFYKVVSNPSRRNPADASAKVFEEFHGYEPSEVVTVTKKVHFHSNLASLGVLVFLKVWGVDKLGHDLTGFKGAILASNEDRNQLFIEGGDQSIDLADFGIRKGHEMETLGKVLTAGYSTDKTHLGSEGGKAVYVHDFTTTNQNGKHVKVPAARLPQLIYDVRNAQLLFSGGSYEILAEGINK